MSGMNFKKEARDAKKREKRQLKRQKHAARKQSASEQQSQVSKGNDDARFIISSPITSLIVPRAA